MDLTQLNPQPDQMPSIPLAPPTSPPVGEAKIPPSQPSIEHLKQKNISSSAQGSSLAQINPTGSSLRVDQSISSPSASLASPLAAQQAQSSTDPRMQKKSLILPKSLVLLVVASALLLAGYFLVSGSIRSFFSGFSSSQPAEQPGELAPNPTCDNACQTNLDCEGRAGGKSVRLECVKEGGSAVGKCRNPLCASAVSCACPASLPTTPQ